MATGASTAQLAVLFVDARKGIRQQTRRHSLIAWHLGIRQIIVAVNKMDLVAFDEHVFSAICDDFNEFAGFFDGARIHFVPLSALEGDNVTKSCHRMTWYQGHSLLHLLETVPGELTRDTALRFPIQAVIRPSKDFRGYAGQVSSGGVRVGQDVVALPSGQRTKVKEIHFYHQALDCADPGHSVVLTTTDHIDLGRGDMLVTPDHPPASAAQVTANVIWMSPVPLRPDARYLVKHTSKVVCGKVNRVHSRIDIHTFEKLAADCLHFNEIGEIQIDLHHPIFCDPYRCNRTTGSFILIDPVSNDTVGAGMILEAVHSQCLRRYFAAHIGNTDSCFEEKEGVGDDCSYDGASQSGGDANCRLTSKKIDASNSPPKRSHLRGPRPYPPGGISSELRPQPG